MFYILCILSRKSFEQNKSNFPVMFHKLSILIPCKNQRFSSKIQYMIDSAEFTFCMIHLYSSNSLWLPLTPATAIDIEFCFFIRLWLVNYQWLYTLCIFGWYSKGVESCIWAVSASGEWQSFLWFDSLQISTCE